MTNIITTILRAVNKNKALINSHIGQGGTDVHPDGDYLQSGFMNPREKYMANNKTITVEDGTDIFSLESGRYSGRNFTNRPVQADESRAIVNIIKASDSDYFLVDYFWINAKKVFHAYRGLNDALPVWWNPILGQALPLKNGVNGSVTMSAYRYDDNLRVKLNVKVSDMVLAPGKYIDVSSLGLQRFFPEHTISYGSAATDNGMYQNCVLQVTSAGDIRVINTTHDHILGSCVGDLEYTIDNSGALAN